MAKTAEQKLEEALSDYAAGKSLRECEKLHNINYKKIDREAKKRGIEKGAVSQLIADKTRVDAEFGTLSVTMQQTVTKEVELRLKHIDFFNHAAITNVKAAMSDRCENQNDYRARAETINKGREAVLGKTPDTVINNTNAQQTNIVGKKLEEMSDDELAIVAGINT